MNLYVVVNAYPYEGFGLPIWIGSVREEAEQRFREVGGSYVELHHYFDGEYIDEIYPHQFISREVTS